MIILAKKGSHAVSEIPLGVSKRQNSKVYQGERQQLERGHNDLDQHEDQQAHGMFGVPRTMLLSACEVRKLEPIAG